VGQFLLDKSDGEFTDKAVSMLEAQGCKPVDIKEYLNKLHAVKLPCEVVNERIAARFVAWTFSELINHVEDVIDADKPAKHSAIANKMENCLDDPSSNLKKFCQNNKVSPDHFEYPMGVLVQSGPGMTLHKFGEQSNNEKLSFSTIYINVDGKYKDMHAMASRTIFIDAVNSQKTAYTLALEALDVGMKSLKVGKPIKEAYIAARNFIQEKNPGLAEKLHNNIGFGIGSNFKEDNLVINASNETIVQANMIFHIRIAMGSLDKLAEKSAIAIGDTVLIKEEGDPEILTSKIPRKFGEVSYFINDEEEEKKGESKDTKEESKTGGRSHETKIHDELKEITDNQDVIRSSRLREKNVAVHQNDEARKENQVNLLNQKLEELKIRLNNDEITTEKRKEKARDMSKIQAYANPDHIPRDLKPGVIYVDKNHDCVLLPMKQEFVPFHISAIKNVYLSTEGNNYYLRFSFNTPGGGMAFPDMSGASAIYIKDLIFKSGDKQHL